MHNKVDDSSNGSSNSSKPRKTTLPDTPRSPYACGRIRAITDHERSAVERFVAKHAEYGALAHAQLDCVAETYRDEDDLALREALANEGVDLSYEADAADESTLPWSDER